MSLLQVFVCQELQVECCISCQMAKLQQSLYCLLSKLLSYPSFNSTFLTQENSNCQLRNARIHSFALYIFIILINYLFFWPSCHMTYWRLHNFLIYPLFQYSFRNISQLLPSKCRSCCCTLTFRILHLKVYDILECKNFLIGFLDELGNFKQKNFTFKNVFFFTIYSNRPIDIFCHLKKG